MKKLLLVFSALVATNSFAGATGGYTNGDAGIVTPDMARGMRAFHYYTHDQNGDMVVCDFDDYSRGNCKGGWKLARSKVPPGNTYIGFRIVSREYGYRQIEIYWK